MVVIQPSAMRLDGVQQPLESPSSSCSFCSAAKPRIFDSSPPQKLSRCNPIRSVCLIPIVWSIRVQYTFSWQCMFRGSRKDAKEQHSQSAAYFYIQTGWGITTKQEERGTCTWPRLLRDVLIDRTDLSSRGDFH